MIKFLDGPAADEVLFLRRAPVLLRVTRSPTGKWDALDQLDDEPRPREKIFVYRRVSEPTRYHMKMCPRSGSGFYMNAEYKLFAEQPADEIMRETVAWRKWCEEKKAEENSPATSPGATTPCEPASTENAAGCSPGER